MIQRLLSHKLAVVLAIAIIARLVILLAFPSVFAYEQTGAIHGSDAYDKYARHLNETGVYGLEPGVPDAAIPPLYGYTLSVVYGIFGRGYIPVGVFHTLLDALSIWMLYEITKRLFASYQHAESVALLAGLFYALYPYIIFQNLTLIDTPLFMTLLHAFVLLMVMLREQETFNRQTVILAIAGGVVLGLSTLVRPITPFLAILVALWFLMRLNMWQMLLRLVPVAILSVLMLVPWIVRNFNEFDAFIPMTTTSGANLWQGNNKWTIPVFQAGYDVQWTAPEGVPSTYSNREADAQRFSLAVQFWRDNPDKLPELFWTKFLVHWSIDIAPRYNPQAGEAFALDEEGRLQIVSGDTIRGVNDANTAYDEPIFDVIGRIIHRFYFGALLLLAIAGIWLSRRLWRDVSLLWFVQISMTLIYVIFHPSTRYRAPSDPLLFVLSAFAVVSIINWWLARRKGAAT